MPGKHGPTRYEQRNGCWWQEAASKIIENLPAGDQWEPVALQPRAGWDEGPQPPQDLPVATDPAVLAPRMRQHARRIVIDDLEVRHERRARVESFEEIVR